VSRPRPRARTRRASQRHGRGVQRPAILAAGNDRTTIAYVSTALERRYERDYRIEYELSAPAALERLEQMKVTGEPVALVLAEPWMGSLDGPELLGRTGALHPRAKRALLIDWGDWSDPATADAIRSAIAVGQIDYYVLKPWKAPDELFHRQVTELLSEWSATDASAPYEVTLVGDAWSPRTNEIRSLLARNGVPHAFHPSGGEAGQRALASADVEASGEPVVILLDGRALVDPTNAELAQAYGVSTTPEQTQGLDLVVIGAGPSGLAAAVYAVSEGLSALVVEREAIGGQAGSSSRIRNYLGFARGISGAELAQRAYQQAWTFGARFMAMREVAALRPGDERHVLVTSDGTDIAARCVVLAMGVDYRRLGIPGLEELVGAGVFYGSSPTHVERFTGSAVYVVGGGNSAGQAAIHLGRFARSVSILVRGPDLAASMSQYLIEEIRAMPNIEVMTSTEIADAGGNGRLERLTLRDLASGEHREVEADVVFIMIGAKPHTGWLPSEIRRDDHGFVLTGPDLASDARGEDWPLDRPPHAFETSLPGVFAVGDVRSRSVKRVAAAVGEGSVVIQQIHGYLATQGRSSRRSPPRG
jgi:thioredoxin reductase (NADPH)